MVQPLERQSWRQRLPRWLRRLSSEGLFVVELIAIGVFMAGDGQGAVSAFIDRPVDSRWLVAAAFALLGLTMVRRLYVLHERLDRRADIGTVAMRLSSIQGNFDSHRRERENYEALYESGRVNNATETTINGYLERMFLADRNIRGDVTVVLNYLHDTPLLGPADEAALMSLRVVRNGRVEEVAIADAYSLWIGNRIEQLANESRRV